LGNSKSQIADQQNTDHSVNVSFVLSVRLCTGSVRGRIPVICSTSYHASVSSMFPTTVRCVRLSFNVTSINAMSSTTRVFRNLTSISPLIFRSPRA